MNRRGSVSVRLENKDGYRLQVKLPPTMTARIGIPIDAPDGSATLTLDGKPATAAVTAKTAFLDDISAGQHTITRP